MALDRSGWVNRSWRLPHFLGDASYAIYLTHLYAVILFRVVWEKSGLPLAGPGHPFSSAGDGRRRRGRRAGASGDREADHAPPCPRAQTGSFMKIDARRDSEGARPAN
jgi:hypothetical protein